MASKKHKFHWEYGQFKAVLFHPSTKFPCEELAYNAADAEHARVKAVTRYVARHGMRPTSCTITQLIPPRL